MKRASLSLIMGVLLVSGCLVLGAIKDAQAMGIKQVTSKKGINGWLIRDSMVPIFTLHFAFRGGAALDPVGREGVSEMVSGLLDEGAGPYSSSDFQARLENNSISMRFSAGRDNFSGSLKSLAENRNMAASLLSLALTQPHFDAAPVARIRAQLLSSARRRAVRPSSTARRSFRKLVFGNHPYGRSASGTVESLKKITKQDMAGFVKNRFARDNLVVGAVGNITEDEFARIIDRIFGALPARSTPFSISEAKIKGAGNVVVVDRDIPQSVVVFGHSGIKRNDPDYYAALVMNYALGGGGLTSRLATEIREKRGLAYSVYSRIATYDHGGLFLGRVSTKNDRVAKSIALIRSEWTRMAKSGLGAQELEDSKRYLTGAFFTRLNSSSRIAGLLVGIQLEKFGRDYLAKRNRMIEQVSIKDITRVAKRLMKPSDLTFVIVGRPKGITPKP